MINLGKAFKYLREKFELSQRAAVSAPASRPFQYFVARAAGDRQRERFSLALLAWTVHESGTTSANVDDFVVSNSLLRESSQVLERNCVDSSHLDSTLLVKHGDRLGS